MPGKHARLSPSSAVRWANCPASVALDDVVREKNDGELPDDSSPAAELGTLCHAYAEALIMLQHCDAPSRAHYEEKAAELKAQIEEE